MFERFFDVGVIKERIYPKCDISKCVLFGCINKFWYFKIGGHWNLGINSEGDICKANFQDINENKLIILNLRY